MLSMWSTVSVLNHLNDASTSASMKTPGGQTHVIQGKENLELSLLNGEIKRITDVYNVPDLRKNLLLVGQIVDLGRLILFDRVDALW